MGCGRRIGDLRFDACRTEQQGYENSRHQGRHQALSTPSLIRDAIPEHSALRRSGEGADTAATTMRDSSGGAIRLSDGRIVIANRMTHEIRYFDSTGTWIRSSGRKGQGPGEFSDPFYIQPLRGDTFTWATSGRSSTWCSTRRVTG